MPSCGPSCGPSCHCVPSCACGECAPSCAPSCYSWFCYPGGAEHVPFVHPDSHDPSEPPALPETDPPGVPVSATDPAGRGVEDPRVVIVDPPCSSLKIVTSKPSSLREMGRASRRIDDRPQSLEVEQPAGRPKVNPGQLWTDPDFTVECAMTGLDERQLVWKRPHEICACPVLYSDGACRHDVAQGSLGTCWFLAILNAMADKPELLSQIIPDASYRIGTDAYDGVFQCRFWRLGSWYTVYIDDLLPVHGDTSQLWAASSGTDPNEMWVSLIEKGFAKFHGGYKSVSGGLSGNAFETLTGGLQEEVKMTEFKSPEALFVRLSNALKSGSVLSCSVASEHDGTFGLVGHHSHTITGTAEVPYKNVKKSLIRVRNPWGEQKGEWEGEWSDESNLWDDVSSDVKNRIDFRSEGDGEFWISLPDFMRYFWRVTICNFTPDFNKDGFTDNLCREWTIFGEWNEEKGAGISLSKKFNNPMYTLSVDSLDVEGDGMASVVIQFMYEKKETDGIIILGELYRVNHEIYQGVDHHGCLEKVEGPGEPTRTVDSSLYRYKLIPGQYLVLPILYSNDYTGPTQFCIRVFTARRIDCSALLVRPSVYLDNFKVSPEGHGLQFPIQKQHFEGKWRSGVNSGGTRVRPDTFFTNPQYVFCLTGDEETSVEICLRQQVREPMIPMGIVVYRLSTPGLVVPISSETPRSALDHCASRDEDGDRPVFVQGWTCRGRYVLEPGAYVIILFTEQTTDEKTYMMTLVTRPNVNCTSYHVVW